MHRSAIIRLGIGALRISETAIERANMIKPEDIYDPEWIEWIRMTPAERWAESQKLWATYLALGGSLDPEPDSESPFFDEEEWRQMSTHGRAGVRVIRRCGV